MRKAHWPALIHYSYRKARIRSGLDRKREKKWQKKQRSRKYPRSSTDSLGMAKNRGRPRPTKNAEAVITLGTKKCTRAVQQLLAVACATPDLARGTGS